MAQGWTLLENQPHDHASGGAFRELTAEKEGQRRRVQYWFTDGSRSTANLISRWFASLETGFRGREHHPWLLVSISALEKDSGLLDAMRPKIREEAEKWLR